MEEERYGMSERLNILSNKLKKRGYKILEVSDNSINIFTLRKERW